MNQNILKMYYEMQGKVVFPKPKNNNNTVLAATVAANFASIGFPIPTEYVKELALADADDIVSFYKDNFAMLKSTLGADRNPKPFYPDFPEGCMDKTFVDYFIDQVIYCMSGLQLEPVKYQEEKERFPFIGTPMRRILMKGDKEDLKEVFCMTVKSVIAYSKEQREFMKAYVKENPEEIQVLIDNVDTKNRENAVTTAMLIEELSGNSLHTASFMKQPADLLRYAAFKSVEDPERDAYKAIALRDSSKNGSMPSFAVNRPQRRFIMDCLAGMDKGSGERLSGGMHGHDEEWSRLFKKLHVSDKAWNAPKYDNVKRAISIIQNGESIDRPARRIEEAVKAGNAELAVQESSRIPGDFMRRFDKLYRMAISENKGNVVLAALRNVSARAGIATVTGTIGNLEKRDKDDEVRYFKDKNGKVIKDTRKLRKGFTKDQINAASAIAMEGMAERFAGKPDMGNVYISESLKDVKIPADIRDNSGAIGSMTSGSKMPLGDWDIMRFFITWTNIQAKSEYGGRVDIDLTAAMLDKDMNVVGFCGWNGEKRKMYGNKLGYVYSGDVQDGGPADGDGRAEYIDLNVKLLRENGIAYIVPQLHSYTGQKFSSQPNTCFGVMKRSEKDMGEIFEPSTVVNRFVLDYERTTAAPHVIDLVNREILWMNERANENVASRGLKRMLEQLGRAKDSKTMPLYPLVEANVIANGRKVLSPESADKVFVRDADEMTSIMDTYAVGSEKFVLSTNKEYVTGYLMRDGKDFAQARQG